MNDPIRLLLRGIENPIFCKNCGLEFSVVDAFCEHCGKPNPDFSVQVFEQCWDESFAEESAKCEKGHQADQEVFLQDPSLYQNIRFCSICGQRLVFKIIPLFRE